MTWRSDVDGLSVCCMGTGLTADPRQGAKIRGTYVKWATGEKKRLEDELKTKRTEVTEKEKLVEEARGEGSYPMISDQ